MKLIVGLGNPGIFYAGSRHNIGFRVVKSLSRECKIALKREKGFSCFSGKGRLDQQELILALPLTFMNLSGLAVKALVNKYGIDLADLLIVCDDLDLELGRLKLKPSGSSAGQRGLESIIRSLGAQDFCRLRLGIGRPPKSVDAPNYVLSGFRRSERERARKMAQEAAECCLIWVAKGTDKCMGIYNVKAHSS